ncbi:MAG: hypothetical protein ACKVJU_22925 [Verrucomicrobiales bacterium]
MKNQLPDEENGGLIFAWRHRRKAVLHMSVFFIVSLVIHFGGFYLFQVVYPSAGKVEPVPDKLTILDPENPAVRMLMSKVQDRVVFLRPASEGANVRTSLDYYSIQFVPLFSDREPNVELKFPAKALGLTAGEPEVEEVPRSEAVEDAK